MLPRRQTIYGFFAFLPPLALAVCLGCGGVLAFSQVWRPPASLSPGYAVGVCAVISPSINALQFWWDERYVSGRIFFPLPVSNGLCGFLPWLPGLPRTGLFVVPFFRP